MLRRRRDCNQQQQPAHAISDHAMHRASPALAPELHLTIGKEAAEPARYATAKERRPGGKHRPSAWPIMTSDAICSAEYTRAVLAVF